MQKYRNKKITVNGIKFDSVREARRYKELSLLQRAGEITALELQKEYTLIPAQYTQGKKKDRKCIERACKYKADFVYIDKSGKTIVEDTKGMRTKDYIIKRKLMLYVHGIKINEV